MYYDTRHGLGQQECDPKDISVPLLAGWVYMPAIAGIAGAISGYQRDQIKGALIGAPVGAALGFGAWLAWGYTGFVGYGPVACTLQKLFKS